MSSDKPFPPGKLPGELLSRILPTLQRDDPRVLIGPQVGTDAAAIDMGANVLIVKSDPITFPTDDAAWYLVNVNANDIACMGGTPRWLLVTALLPEATTTETLVLDIFASLRSACDELGIVLVGGHTEITIGLDRPILIGSMLGEATRDELIDPGSVRPGDALLLCKGIAIEGTSILAQELENSTADGIDPSVIATACNFLKHPGISVVNAAQVLRDSGARVNALHDPTEGGIATAIREISAASGHGLEVNLDAIQVYPETMAICEALGLDAFGLIASGALLAAVPADDVPVAIAGLEQANIPCARIGTFVAEPGIRAFDRGLPANLPEFAVDEIARYFSG